MGGKHDLILSGQPVQNIPGYFLKLRMEKNFRVLHHDNVRILHPLFFISFQKRQHINTAHSFSHAPCRAFLLISRLPHFRRYSQRLFNIQIHGVDDLISAAVSAEIFIDSPGKRVQTQIVQLIFQQFCRLKCIQLFRFLLMNQTDTGKAVITFLCHIKHTAPGAHLFEQIILLHHQKIILKFLQISLGIHKINMWKDLWNIAVVLLMPVTVADPSLPVNGKFKSQRAAGLFSRFIGGQLPAEIPVPCLVSAVGADQPESVKPLQIFICNLKDSLNFHIREILPEVLFLYSIVPAHGPHSVQDSRFARVVFSHQYKRIFNVPDMHVSDGPEIPDSQLCNLHPFASCRASSCRLLIQTQCLLKQQSL